jgi:DNA-binding MurR/RpiR family transcriptional regulator
MDFDTEWAERVGRVTGGFSKTEESLLGFISGAPHEAAFFSMQELCAASGVSKPIVIEFYRKLGYDDFKTFREGVKRFYAQHIDSFRASSATFRTISTLEELIAASAEVDARSVRRMADYLSRETLESAANRLLQSETAFLFGPGTGLYPAHYLSERLRRYRIRTHLIESDLQHLAEELFPMGSKDFLVIFEYSTESGIYERVMDYAAAAGAGILLVTDYLNVGLVNRADLVAVVARGEVGFKNSMAVPMAFVNLLTLTIELVGHEKTQHDLKSLEEMRERYAFSYAKTS